MHNADVAQHVEATVPFPGAAQLLQVLLALPQVQALLALPQQVQALQAQVQALQGLPQQVQALQCLPQQLQAMEQNANIRLRNAMVSL